MIASNLGMTHNCIFFLYLSGSFDNTGEAVSSSIRIGLLAIVLIWPFFLTIFLYRNKDKLNDKKF